MDMLSLIISIAGLLTSLVGIWITIYTVQTVRDYKEKTRIKYKNVIFIEKCRNWQLILNGASENIPSNAEEQILDLIQTQINLCNTLFDYPFKDIERLAEHSKLWLKRKRFSRKKKIIEDTKEYLKSVKDAVIPGNISSLQIAIGNIISDYSNK